jgi:uncharacterized protein (DUF885 family)
VNPELEHVADRFHAWRCRAYPTAAHSLGDHDHIDQIEDLSRQTEDVHLDELDSLAVAATSIDGTSLDAVDSRARRILLHEIDAATTPLRHRMLELGADPFMSMPSFYLRLVGSLHLTEAAHAEAMLVKWTKIHGAFGQAVQRLKQGAARDRTPARGPVEAVLAQIDRYLAVPLDRDPFVIMEPPPGFTDAQTADWRNQLSEVAEKHIRPGYQAFRDALVADVLPNARPNERPGLCWLDGGADAYADHIRAHTTVDRAALDIHATGIEIVAQLAEEYRDVGSPALGTADLAAIFSRLRNDPDLYFTTSEDVLAVAEDAVDRAKAAVGRWFGRLPAQTCIVASVPEAVAEETPAGYYHPPPIDGSRPGVYFVNVSDPSSRPRFGSEALAFHEALPGHHLQVALATELEDNHPFQRQAYITAFDEGWGLYAERLADEMGLYSDDLARIGMLAADSLRAGRLVVDTGLHALGWSRQEAIDYLVENSPVPVAEIAVEVDRYICMPGQALGYMLGRLEIQQQRADAERALGDSFDIASFHDVVIGSGGLPLPVLRDVVADWIDATRQG